MIKQFLTLILLSCFLFSSCATVIKGYHSKVIIAKDRSDRQSNIQIQSDQGIEIPVLADSSQYAVSSLDTETQKWETYFYRTLYIYLKSNETHKLTINKNGVSTKTIFYPKVGIGWVTLDILTGVFPLVIDLYTGNLNYFDDLVKE